MSDANRTDWHIRTPTADQLPEFAQPVQMAFGGGLSEAELNDWLKLAEPERWLGAVEPGSDVVAGVASVFSMQLTVPSGEVPAAAVTGVGVRPDQRRRGILRALMTRQLHDIHERGEPAAVLWASEGSIYQRFGYGLSTLDGALDIDTRHTAFVRDVPNEGRVRILDEQEAATLLPQVYETMREVTPGALSRSERWWKEAVLPDPEYWRRGAGPRFRVVYEADGRPEGYALYRVRDEWDERGSKAVLEITEALTTTARSVLVLWRYLFDVDLVRTVKAWRVPLPTPLQHVLAEPRAMGLLVKDGLWTRLVDLPAALAARRYGTADSLALEVTDVLCPWNAGTWLIATEGSAGEAVATVASAGAPADLALDVADLGAIYLGGIRPGELAAVGRIEERTPGTVRRLTAMFASDVTPWCSTMF